MAIAISNRFALTLMAAATAMTTLLSASAAAARCGEASWYGGKFAGKPTANGEIFDPNSMTAAHRTLRFGTRVRVTDQRTGRSVVVRINNRGPFIKGRIIDLSIGAARRLGFASRGVTPVCLKIL